MPDTRNGQQPFSTKEFKQIYSRVPRLCIDLIIEENGKILLTKRVLESWKGLWHLPGGTVYYKERVKDAIGRIAEEEVGVRVEARSLAGYIEYPSEEEERGFGYSVSLAFVCTITKGIPTSSLQGEDPTFFNVLPEQTVGEQKDFLNRNFHLPLL